MSDTSALAYAADRLDPPEHGTHAQWCRQELPHIFELPFGPHHLWLYALIGFVARGVRAFCGAPRGSGKTTAVFVGLTLAALALRSHRFIVICGVTQEEAEARLELIRAELDRNTALTERWPALRVARRGLSLKEIANRKKELVLEGGRIIALGAGASVRGLLRRSPAGEFVRPDLFLGDDLETSAQARSKLLTDRLEEWVFADVSQLGANLKLASAHPMDVILIGTTIDTDALATRAIKRKGRFAAWQTASFPAELRHPDGTREAGWPAGQPLELLDQLLDPNSERFIGGWTYAKEYLLDPLERGDTVVKRASIIRGRVPRRQDGRVDLRFIAEGIDPAATESAHKSNDYSAIVSVGLDSLNRVWVFRAWRGQVSSSRLFDVAEGFVGADSDSSIAFEAVGGFRWGLGELRRRNLPHRGVQPSTDKLSRFQPIALLYESNARGVPAIIHDESLAETTFEEELLSFPTGDHDDFCDALWLAVSMATLAGRRTVRSTGAA